MVITQHGAILAQEGGAALTVAAQPNGTLHVPFHGDKDVVCGHATLLQGHNGEEAAERKAEDLPARIKAQEQYINVKEVERCKNEEYMIKLFK